MAKLRLVAPVLAMAWLALPVASAAARDRNHDGLPDRWEKRYGLSTTHPVGRRDPDHDGLSNRREHHDRTNPRRRDTDRDGLKDRAEVKRYHTNPRRRDTDRDGLRDRAEVKRYHTNPRRRDTDGDGFSDGAEVRAGTDPRSAATHPSPAPATSGAPAPPATGGPAPGVPPSPTNVGVPAGWAPAETRTSDLVATQPGAVVQDVLFKDADLVVKAPNVTVRRVDFQGGVINNWQGGSCQSGMLIEDSTFEPAPGQQYVTESAGVTGFGGYTARRVKIWRREEGFRDGGKSGGCGPVNIEDSFVKISIPPGCPGDPHADGVQGYDGPPLTVSNLSVDFTEASCGTAPFFVPANQGNTTADVNGLLVNGGGESFRDGVPGTVKGLKIVDRSWYYAPVDVRCSLLNGWDAHAVTIDANYHVTSTRGAVACSGTGT